MLTYDRAVIKPYLAIVSAANVGKLLPLRPDSRPELIPTSREDPVRWRFTTEKPADDWAFLNWLRPAVWIVAWGLAAATSPCEARVIDWDLEGAAWPRLR